MYITSIVRSPATKERQLNFKYLLVGFIGTTNIHFWERLLADEGKMFTFGRTAKVRSWPAPADFTRLQSGVCRLRRWRPDADVRLPNYGLP